METSRQNSPRELQPAFESVEGSAGFRGAVAMRLHTCVATVQKWGLMLPSCQRTAEGCSCTQQPTAEAKLAGSRREHPVTCCTVCAEACCTVLLGCSYVRLELLEGVVAFHSGEQQLAQQRLQSAQARWRKLQVGGASQPTHTLFHIWVCWCACQNRST